MDTLPREYLSVRDAVAVTGLDGETLKAAIGRGALKAFRPGLRKILIARADLEEFIRARPAATTAPGPAGVVGKQRQRRPARNAK